MASPPLSISFGCSRVRVVVLGALLAVGLGFLLPATPAAAAEGDDATVPIAADDVEPQDPGPGDPGEPAILPECIYRVAVEDDFLTEVVRIDGSGTDTLQESVDTAELVLEIVLDALPLLPSIDVQIDTSRRFSETGRWLSQDCISRDGAGDAILDAAGNPVYVQTDFTDGQRMVPESPEVLVPDLISRARDVLDPPYPNAATAPLGDLVTVGIPTWMWVDAAYWQPYSERATAGRVWVEAIATPVYVIWETDDDQDQICYGPGLRYNARASESDACTHTYAHSSATRPGNTHQLTAHVVFDITWTSNLPDLDARYPNRYIGQIVRSDTETITVGEIHALSG